MTSELESIHKNHTWDLVRLPASKKVITPKWIYRMKANANGTLVKVKAQSVAKGFQQQEGVYYNDTFAPVVKWNIPQNVIALARHPRWKIFHLDVKMEFLNGIIDEDIYVLPPHSFEPPNNYSCKLNKALFGPKQAPQA